MSCGNDHEMPCVEVLSVMYLFIDNEHLPCAREQVTVHLTECQPCKEQYTAQANLKLLIQQALSGQCAPPELHQQLRATITQIEIEVTAEFRELD